MLRIFELAESAWKHRVTHGTLFVLFSIGCLWWAWHIPTVGYAIGALGFVAAVMAALLENLKAFGKFAWIVLLFGFLLIEMRAIDEDKKTATRDLTNHFKSISQQSQDNLKRILDDEDKHFRDMLQSEQGNFFAIMSQQNREFNALLAKQQQLFQRQQEFAEFLNGKLLPASDPMPINTCTWPIQKDDVALFLGTNVFVTRRFPYTVVKVNEKDAISLDRTADGSLILSVDIRDASNRIVARLNKNGFVVNSNYSLFMLRPDKSTVTIEDQFGEEMLRARFLNPRAFSLKGVLPYRGTSTALELPFMQQSCSFYSGAVMLNIR